MAERITLPPLGLYVHLPWCTHKCPYCDFNSHALHGELPEQGYVDALLRDAEQQASTVAGRTIQSVFIGGGTPSLFSDTAIDRLLNGLAAHLCIDPNAEITLEANPGSAETKRFAGFRAAGVNRLSIGVQSFQDDLLQRLGRVHNSAEAQLAISAAQTAGFERINVDLMHGLPQQTQAAALDDVHRALSADIQHISHYQLTLEPNTPFFTRPPTLPGEDTLADIEAVCAEALTAAGLQRYEISAWAAPGQECQHNLNYWGFGDYLAIGAGAHGKLSESDGRVLRYAKIHLPRLYQKQAGTTAATAQQTVVPDAERALEYAMNALRLTDGTPLDQAIARTGLPAEAFTQPAAIARQRGWLTADPTRLQPTPVGQRFLNDLLGLF